MKKKCRSGSMIHHRNGVIVAVSPRCHNRECDSCRMDRAKTYAREMNSPIPMILFYKVLPKQDANQITKDCNRDGEYYWKCPMDSSFSAIITTKPINGGIPFPAGDDGDAIIDGWIKSQSPHGHVSHTRSAVPRHKNEDGDKWETYFIAKTESRKIKSVLELSGWRFDGRRFFAKDDTVDWNTLSQILNTLDIPVTKRIVKGNADVKHNSILLDSGDSINNYVDNELEPEYSLFEDLIMEDVPCTERSN